MALVKLAGSFFARDASSQETVDVRHEEGVLRDCERQERARCCNKHVHLHAPAQVERGCHDLVPLLRVVFGVTSSLSECSRRVIT
eukprot:3231920-Prymnesium_polylepis.1